MLIMNLEKKDFDLLNALIENSRSPLTQLSKKVRMNREKVNYQLNNLEKKEIIKSKNAIINTKLLGFKQYALFIQLNDINKIKEQELIKQLSKQDYVSWIGILVSKWSMVLDIYAKDEIEASKKTHEILQILSPYIKNYALLTLENKEYYIKKLLDLKENNISQKIKQEPKLNIDEIDLEIMKFLNKNSRTTYADLSKRLSLTANAIKKRIKNLVKNNLILGYSITLDHKVFNYELYGIQLKILSFNDNIINKIIMHFREEKRVLFFYKYLAGQWNFDIGVIVKNSDELREFINDLREKFSEELTINDFYIISQEITNNRLPTCIFNK